MTQESAPTPQQRSRHSRSVRSRLMPPCAPRWRMPARMASTASAAMPSAIWPLAFRTFWPEVVKDLLRVAQSCGSAARGAGGWLAARGLALCDGYAPMPCEAGPYKSCTVLWCVAHLFVTQQHKRCSKASASASRSSASKLETCFACGETKHIRRYTKSTEVSCQWQCHAAREMSSAQKRKAITHATVLASTNAAIASTWQSVGCRVAVTIRVTHEQQQCVDNAGSRQCVPASARLKRSG